MKPEVYFSRVGKSGREQGLSAVLDSAAGLLSRFGEGSFVGIKVTVGDEKSTGYIKAGLVRLVVERLREQGAKPFVFDTNVIYKGRRQNAVDHLDLAYRKGFTPDKLGCPYIIADGVFGTDSHAVKVNFKNIREIKIPSTVKVLEDLVVLTHITGHLMSGFAGSLKNVAMGMASRAGKQIQHSSLKPTISTKKCALCGLCMEICPASAISEASGKVFINSGRCIGCCECISACKFDAVNINWKEDANIFVERMAEYACGILSQIRRKIFLNFAMDITQECDCISGDDPGITEDAGIFASEDILAVDKACFDMLTRSKDIFSRGGRITAHLHQFGYAREIGLGNPDYRLIEL